MNYRDSIEETKRQDVAKDSAFPFDIGEKVIVQIKNNKLQITKQ